MMMMSMITAAAAAAAAAAVITAVAGACWHHYRRNDDLATIPPLTRRKLGQIYDDLVAQHNNNSTSSSSSSSLQREHVEALFADLKLSSSCPRVDNDTVTFAEFVRLVHEHFSHTRHGVDVFLGGACGVTTWRRDEAIPLLDAKRMTYYNPQVDEWRPELMVLEELMKIYNRALVFVIGSQTRSIASMIEAAQCIVEGQRVVLVIEQVHQGTRINNHLVSKSESADLNRGRAYLTAIAKTYGVRVHPTITQAIDNLHI